jgi:large subunit ribosomal protein L4
MNSNLYNISKKVTGSVKLIKSYFELDLIPELAQRVIRSQLLSRMSGCHKVKNVGEVSGSNKKPFKQKGTGNARQGNKRAPHMRSGGSAHGPSVRSHSINLPKKVKKLVLKQIISYLHQNDRLFFIDSFLLNEISTSNLSKNISNFTSKNNKKILFIYSKVNNNFLLSARSIRDTKVLHIDGLNSYDLLNSDTVLFDSNAINSLYNRLA